MRGSMVFIDVCFFLYARLQFRELLPVVIACDNRVTGTNTFWTLSGHCLDTCWKLSEHFLDTVWTWFGHGSDTVLRR